MAKIMYQNENNLLLEPREAFYRPFDLGQWTELRIGMLFRMVGVGSDSSSIATETVPVNTNSDKIFIGIKDSGSNLPGVGNTNFIGVATVSGSIVRSMPTVLGSDTISESGSAALYPRLNLIVYSSSFLYQHYGTFTNQSNTTAPYFSGSASGSQYNGFYGLKYVLQNSGSDNQKVLISYRIGVNPGSSSADLHSQLASNLSWTTLTLNDMNPTTASWNPGVPLPNSFFVYTPFYNNRLRMSAIEVLKIS
jgi:hypothetical protein